MVTLWANGDGMGDGFGDGVICGVGGARGEVGAEEAGVVVEHCSGGGTVLDERELVRGTKVWEGAHAADGGSVGGGFLVCPLGDGMVVEADSNPPYFKEGAGEAGAGGEVSEEVSNVGAAR